MQAARRNAKKQDRSVEGCKLVTIAGEAAPVTGLEGTALIPVQTDVESPENCPAGEKIRRLQGEMATDKMIYESMGDKTIRRARSGSKLGGLGWKDSEMAVSVANWSLNKLSFKAAGKNSNFTARAKGTRFWFKAEPRRNNKTRRLTSNKPVPLPDISTTSMRSGVFAMDLAKNFMLIEKVRTAHSIAICSDLLTVGENLVQGTHMWMFEWEVGGTDGAGTI
jgi:hypothetical protein